MAGDWIPIRINLSTDPRTVAIAGRIRKHVLHTVGALSVVWGAANEHTTDGRLMGYTLDAIDAMVGIKGFAAAMEAVGWMFHDDESITVPDFDRYNSDGAKARLKHARRVAASREDHKTRTERAQNAHANRTKTATTEQNRTEQKNSSSSSAASAVTAAAGSTQRGGEAKHPILAALHDRGIGEPTATALLDEGVTGADIAAVERASDAGDGPGLWVNRLREAIAHRASTAKAREAREAARAAFDALDPSGQHAKLLEFRAWAAVNGLECRHMANPLLVRWGKFVEWLVDGGVA
jgi:hypothetical protein